MIKAPSGWKRQAISDLCEFSNGYGFKPTDWAKAGVPIIRIQNLNGSKNFNYFARKPQPEWLVQPGELLFAWAGVRGVSFGPTIWNGPLGVLNQHIYRIHPKSGVEKEWLFLALKLVTARIEAKAHGFKSSLVHVRKSDIDSQIVFVPDEALQKHIAEIVRTWTVAIQKHEALLAAKVERKQGLMQQLQTGQTRFKEFKGERWRHCHLGDVVESVSRPVAWDENELYRLAIVRRWCSGVDLRESLHGHEIKVKKLQTIRTGDFLISHIQAAYGAMALVPKEFDGAKVSELYTILRPKDAKAFDIRILGYLGQTKRMWYMAIQASNGFFAERLRLNFDPEDFLHLPVNIPPTFGEQKKIADTLETCDREIELLEKQLEALKEQKRGLMQKLLTGEVRVKAESGKAESGNEPRKDAKSAK